MKQSIHPYILGEIIMRRDVRYGIHRSTIAQRPGRDLVELGIRVTIYIKNHEVIQYHLGIFPPWLRVKLLSPISAGPQ